MIRICSNKKNRSHRLASILCAGVLLLSGMCMVAAAPAVYAGTPQEEVCDAIGSGAGCNKASRGSDVQKAIVFIVNFLSVIGGVVAVVMLILGGLKYTASGGDTNKVAAAKATIIHALIGLVIVALSQFIVIFVLKKTSGSGPDVGSNRAAPRLVAQRAGSSLSCTG